MTRWQTATGVAVATTIVSSLIAATAIANDSDMFCYMRTESGRLVNLGDVCGADNVNPEAITSTSPSSIPSTSPPSSTLSNPEDINAFMTGCTDSILAEGGTIAEASQYCGCFVRGLQNSGMSNEQLLSLTDAILDPNAPQPDLALQDAFAEVVFTCILTGGLIGG